jgi:SecD/SecF fusion protein
MTIKQRIQAADPLGGVLPSGLPAPQAPPNAFAAHMRAPKNHRARRWVAVSVASAVCLGAALFVALPSTTTEQPAASARTFSVLATTGRPASPALVASTAKVLRARLTTVDPRHSSVAVVGARTIQVVCEQCSKPPVAASLRVTQPGQLHVYDWEANVLNASCHPDPTRRQVTGGTAAGQPGAGTVSYYQAVMRAAHCPPRHLKLMSHSAAVYYTVDPVQRRVLGPPQPTASLARGAIDANRDAGVRIIRVQPGTIILRALGDKSSSDNAAHWYVLRDDAALSGRQIAQVSQGAERSTGGPTVQAQLTPGGKEAWHTFTARIARRGQALVRPGQPVQDVAQHFAIALDNQLLIVPFINPQISPNGIDARSGIQIAGGLSRAQAKVLVGLLRSGALPAHLVLAPGTTTN